MKLDNEQILGILKQLFEKNGKEMVTDARRVNAYLMDLAPENDKERKLIAAVIREGIGAELLKVTDKSADEQEYCIRKCIMQIKNDIWITDEAAEFAVSIIGGSLGISVDFQLSETLMSDTSPADSASGMLVKGEFTGGDDELNAALTAYLEIGYKALAVNMNIENAVIPDNIKTIMSKAFLNCINLETIQLPAGLESIGSRIFLGCSNLKRIIISQSRKFAVVNGMLINKEKKTLIRSQNEQGINDCRIPAMIEIIEPYAFDCSPASCIKIPKSVKTIGYDAFIYCMQLEKFDVEPHNMTFSSVDGVLHSRDRKKLIRYPSGRKNVNYIIEDEVEEIAESAFSTSAFLESVTFTNNLKSIGIRAFEKCINLEALMLPASVEVIGERAFQFCEKLSSVMLPRSIKEIGDFAFCECSSIKTIGIPKYVQRIGHAAFKDCTSLEKIIIQSEVSFIGNSAFDGCKSDFEVCIKDNSYVEMYCQARGIKYSRL